MDGRYDGGMRPVVRAAFIVTVLLAQLGATPRVGPTTPAGPMLDRLHDSLRQPVPRLPPPAGRAPSDVWVPDRLVPGTAAGFPDADFVVVASRRKPG